MRIHSHSLVSGWTNKNRMSETLFLIVQTVFGIVDFGLFCCAIVGNSVVIYVISRDKKLKSKSNIHILSVALADLLIGVLGIPLGVLAGTTGIPHDFQLCLALNSVLLSLFAVSMFSLVAVSFDRCWAICYPVTYHVTSKRFSRIMISCCWIFGIFLGSLPILGWHSGLTQHRCDLRIVADFNYVIFVCVFIGWLSTAVIIVLYIRIYRTILKQSKKRQDIVANSTELKKQKYEIQAAHTLAMIVGTFIVLWTPGMMSIFVMAVTKNRDFPLDIIQFTTILVHLNAAIDPLIYAYRMKNIREALNLLFTCCKRNRQIAPTNSVSNDSNRSSSTKHSNSNV